MKRAYSRIQIKAFDDDKREFSGIATTPTPDRMGDIVEPEGAQYELPIPLLWQHMSDKPVGEVFQAKVSKSGISVRGRIFHATMAQSLIERLDEAWESIKIGLVKGLSIGFVPVEESRINDTYSYRYIKWDWLELSAVTIPANVDGTITSIKSIARREMAASGQRKGAVLLEDEIRRACRKSGAIYLPPLESRSDT